MKQKNNGITLIALVITVIILLILSAVTIATLTGENGLLEKAKLAKEETEKNAAPEKMTMKITTAQIQSYAEKQEMATLEYLYNYLKTDGDMEYVETESKAIGDTEDIFAGIEYIYTKLKEYPYEFGINSNLQLASINGELVETGNNVSNDVSNNIVVYLDGKKISNIPDNINDEYRCDKIECSDDIIASFNTDTWSLSISNIRDVQFECSLYFITKKWKYANVDNGVYAYYPLKSNLNNVVEGSDINDITYSSGTVTFNSDKSVTKTGDSLKISNLTKLPDEFTIGIDFCYTSMTTSPYLFGTCWDRSVVNGMLGVSLLGNSTWQTWNGSSNDRQYIYPDIVVDKWYRLVVTGGNEKFNVYLNGELIAQRSGYNCSTGSFNIIESNTGESFGGKMRNLIIYNRCLSEEEVSGLEF